MSWLLHPEPLGPIPFRQGRECRRQASGEFLYQVLSHPLLGGVSCSSIVGLNKSPLFQRGRKKDEVYLSCQPGEHKLRRAFDPIPVFWAMATTGKRRRNQRKTCPHSWPDKRRESLPGIHWYRQTRQDTCSRRTEYNFWPPDLKPFKRFAI